MGFELPHSVTAERTPISPTSFEYTFRHAELGELGTVLFCARITGGCHITHQAFKAAQDERSEQRLAIFEPIAKAVAEHLRAASMMQ